MVKTLEVANEYQLKELNELAVSDSKDKIAATLKIFKDCGVDKWAMELKEKYISTALQHLEDIAVVTSRKEPMKKLVALLVKRET